MNSLGRFLIIMFMVIMLIILTARVINDLGYEYDPTDCSGRLTGCRP